MTDDPLPFISLANITANVLTFLRLGEEKKERADDEAKGRDNDQSCRLDHLELVRHRLKELAAFERRANGKK